MTQIGMGEEEQTQVFEVVAGVLHLGNVDFYAITGGVFPDSLITTCSLWGLEPTDVYTKLTSKDVVGQVVLFQPEQVQVKIDYRQTRTLSPSLHILDSLSMFACTDESRCHGKGCIR